MPVRVEGLAPTVPVRVKRLASAVPVRVKRLEPAVPVCMPACSPVVVLMSVSAVSELWTAAILAPVHVATDSPAARCVPAGDSVCFKIKQGGFDG